MLDSLFRFLLVMYVSQSRHKKPRSEPSSCICGCPAKNSGLEPKRFFKSVVEHTEVDPEHLVIIIAFKNINKLKLT